MLRRITSGLRIPPFFWGVAFGFLFAILSRRPTPEVGGPLIDTTIISRAAECPACPQSGSPLPCAASSATDLEPISPALLAQGPQSPGTAAYYDPIASTLSRLGPPAPSCFEGLDKPPAVPRKWDTVLIIAQGRSGSTSLLRLLNTLPCYNIRGENPNVFTYVVGKGPRPPKKQTGDTYMQAVGMIAEKMEPWQEKWHDTDMKQKPSWFNRLDVPRSNAVVRLLVSETLEHVPDRVTSGFKSITLFSPRGQNYNISRWFMDDWIRLFPRTGVVFITRKGVENSGWWRVTGNSAGLMATQAEWFARFHQEIPQRYKKDSLPKQRVESVMVDYDDLVKCRHVPGSTLEAMYQMLGETWDPSRCKAVMGTNIEDWGVAMSEFEFSGVQVGSTPTATGSIINNHPTGRKIVDLWIPRSSSRKLGFRPLCPSSGRTEFVFYQRS